MPHHDPQSECTTWAPVEVDGQKVMYWVSFISAQDRQPSTTQVSGDKSALEAEVLAAVCSCEEHGRFCSNGYIENEIWARGRDGLTEVKISYRETVPVVARLVRRGLLRQVPARQIRRNNSKWEYHTPEWSE